MIRIILAAAIAAAAPTAALAEISIDQMGKANGIAEILKREKPCGYKVDPAKLEKYYVAEGLATPEVLSYISAAVRLADYDPKPTPADCSITKATAQAIDILAA